MKQVTVSIKLHYGGDRDAEVETNGVPITMVLESLNTLVKGMAQQLLEECAEVIPGPDQEKYLDARIALDRHFLKVLIAKSPDVATNELPRYSFRHMIEFAQWYSGMDAAKVIAAYTRYLKEKKL